MLDDKVQDNNELLNNAMGESIQPNGHSLSWTSDVTLILFLLKHILREYQDTYNIKHDFLLDKNCQKVNNFFDKILFSLILLKFLLFFAVNKSLFIKKKLNKIQKNNIFIKEFLKKIIYCYRVIFFIKLKVLKYFQTTWVAWKFFKCFSK